MRGISGSGKSYLAKQLAEGDESKIFSTDDFYGKTKEEYIKNWDVSKMAEAHDWNQKRAIEAMRESVSPVIVDNTNTQAWEAKPYVEAAQELGYRVIIKEPAFGSFTPENLDQWASDVVANRQEDQYDELAEILAQKNKHGVPKEAILRMLQRWEPNLTAEKILQSERPF